MKSFGDLAVLLDGSCFTNRSFSKAIRKLYDERNWEGKLDTEVVVVLILRDGGGWL